MRGWLTAAAVFVGVYILWVIVNGALADFLLLFAAILFSIGIQPLIDRLSRQMPFGAAVSIAFGAVLLLVALIAYALAAPVVSEVERTIRTMPAIVSALQDRIAATQRFLAGNHVAQQIGTSVINGAGGALAAIGAHFIGRPPLVVTITSDAVVIILLALGWTFASKDLGAFVFSLLPPKAEADWRLAFETIGARMAAYVQGVALNGAIVGVVVGVALGLLAIPYALLLAAIAAILQGIPMVGAVISGVILLLAVLATGGWTKMIAILIVFIVVQIVDQNVISPLIFGKRLQLSFLLIIFSTILGGTLLGIPGAFLAVPAAAALQVIVTLIIAPAIRRANQGNL